MIDAINGAKYDGYTVVGNQTPSVKTEETKEAQVKFDIQEILNQIDEYTYTKQDQESVSKDLVSQIKQEFNIKEEDVYELYKRGIDLEKLNVYEIEYLSSNKVASLEVAEAEQTDASLKDKIETIKKQNDNMYANALSYQGPITINSLYESNFKGNVKGLNQYTQEDVDNVLSMNGLDTNGGNRWAANLLMMYDMGVSPTSVNRLQNIQSAVTALNETGMGLSGDDELIKNGQVQYEPEYVHRIVDELGMVTDEHIESLIEEGAEISIDTLRESIHKNASEALDEHTGQSFNGNQSQQETFSKSQQTVDEVKRQILQITTKLTVEAAQKLSEKMPVESSSLQSVAEALGQMEQEMAVSALQKVNVPVTAENIAIVTDTMSTVNTMSQNFMPSVQIEMTTGENATLDEVSVALDKYLAHETPVEARFGESIKTVESQIQGLLESQGIEVNTTNIEAAKALITNHMEVNAANIRSISETVIKLDTFLEEMTPVQVASMIKEGFNPYQSTVNEILAWMSDRKVTGLQTSVAEAIVAMEESGAINEEQKEGMIGIYKILQAVDKQKEQVMGYLFRNELPMTVENLQMAAKYVKGKNRIEATIDDNFGEIESRTISTQTASNMIEKSTQESKKTLDILRTLENMALPITEENMSKVSKMNALLYPYIKEQFKAKLGKFDGMSTLPESFLEKVQTVQSVDQEVIASMLEQDIPLTLSNIYWMDKMTQNPDVYGELLNDKGLLKEGLPKDLEELEEDLKAMELEAKEQKEEATLTGEWNEYRSYKNVEEMVKFQRQRIENEGLYQIPFMIDGERRMINLYVHDGEGNSVSADSSHLKAVISYETKTMGQVKAYIEMNGEQLGYRVEAEKVENSEALKTHAEKLALGLKSIGYNVSYSEFNSVAEEVANSTSATTSIKHDDSQFEEII